MSLHAASAAEARRFKAAAPQSGGETAPGYPAGMTLPDPRKITVGAVAMLALAHCPVCGGVGEEKPRHPFAPKIECAWCRERQVVIERCLRWLKEK